MWYHQHTLLIDLGTRYCEISLVEASSRSDCDWTNLNIKKEMMEALWRASGKSQGGMIG